MRTESVASRHGSRPRRYMAISLAGLGLLAPFMTVTAAGLSDWFSGRSPDFPLPSEEAFVFDARPAGVDNVLVHWDIVTGYYLYRDKMRAESGGGDILTAPLPPPTEVLEDPNFGCVAVYRRRVEWALPRPEGDDVIRVRYQGCKDDSVCYPPQVASLSLSPTGGVLLSSVSDALSFTPAKPSPAAEAGPGQDSNGAGLAIVVAAYLIGLGLALTPCVLPLLPIVSSLVVGVGAKPVQAAWLSMVYVGSMAIVYGGIGALAAALNFNAQAAVQRPVFVISFSVLLFALGLAMFDVFPSRWLSPGRQWLDKLARSVPGGNTRGALVLGALSAIMVGPCTAPPVLAGLAWSNVTGSPLSGGLALFAMGLGLGTPLLLVGLSAGFLLPGPGPWMIAVKSTMGLGLIALAIWNAQYLLPELLAVALWSVLLISVAVLIGALEPLSPQGGVFPRFKKIVGLIFLAYGIALAFPVARQAEYVPWPVWHRDNTVSEPLAFTDVRGVSGLNEQLHRAAAGGRPVMVNVRADWCVVCRRMERDTFTDDRVRAITAGVSLLRVDVTDFDADAEEVLAAHGLYGPPAVLFFSADGSERKAFRVYEFMDGDRFGRHLREALNL